VLSSAAELLFTDHVQLLRILGSQIISVLLDFISTQHVPCSVIFKWLSFSSAVFQYCSFILPSQDTPFLQKNNIQCLRFSCSMEIQCFPFEESLFYPKLCLYPLDL